MAQLKPTSDTGGIAAIDSGVEPSKPPLRGALPCRTVHGQLYYRGISRVDAKQATTLAAKTIPGGYEARAVVDGNVFVYRVAHRRLVVTEDGKPIPVDAIIATL